MNYDEMPSGAELDRLIAEKVMGWKINGPDLFGTTVFDDGKCGRFDRVGSAHGLPVWPAGDQFSPSTNIAHAWEVMEKMRSIGNYMIVEDCAADWDAYIPTRTNLVRSFGRGHTAPLAICRAALKACQ